MGVTLLTWGFVTPLVKGVNLGPIRGLWYGRPVRRAYPKRYYGLDRKLKYPENTIHPCSWCGTHYLAKACPTKGKRIDHRAGETCSQLCGLNQERLS